MISSTRLFCWCWQYVSRCKHACHLGAESQLKSLSLCWEHTLTAKHLDSKQLALSPVFSWGEQQCWGHRRNFGFLFTKDDNFFQSVAISLYRLVHQCYSLCLSTHNVSAPDHRDPAVVKPLWSFHWGIWQYVSSISIKRGQGLGDEAVQPL